MRISVFGLGYVGSVTGACLASSGHQVMGVDIDDYKLRLLQRGQSPITEPGLAEIVREVVADGRLRVTPSADRAVRETEMSVICVGTPSGHNGNIDLSALRKVAAQIGAALRRKKAPHAVVNRSTVLPGTTEEVLVEALEAASGKEAGRHFEVFVNPEFMREGSSVHDFFHPPCVVIGRPEGAGGGTLRRLYDGLDLAAPLYETNLRVAEFVKYASNAFHATKIAFANELGNIAKGLGIDSHAVMDIFAADTKLNLSAHYLKPGFAFGGSCLPKDVRALAYRAKQLDLEVPLLSSLMASNENQLRLAFDMIRRTGKTTVGVLGLSFKPHTDDLRESPTVELVEMLIGKGYRVLIHDEEVTLSRVIGANKRYVRRMLPHISRLLKSDLGQLVARSEVIVVAKRSAQHEAVVRSVPKDKTVIDLVRIFPDLSDLNGCRYQGICW